MIEYQEEEKSRIIYVTDVDIWRDENVSGVISTMLFRVIKI